MGYYARFELDVISGDVCIIDCKETIIEQVGYDPFDEEVTWRTFEMDMKNVSKRYPKSVFELSGEGESVCNLWKAYFKNGKVQMCKAKIVYDNFDESLLQ